MKKIVLWVLLLLPTVALSQANEQEMLRAIDSKIDLLLKDREKLLVFVDKNPLGEKRYGVELNWLRLLTLASDRKTFSGTVSYFDHKNRIEWAVPLYLGIEEDEWDFTSYVFTADLHYRKFLGKVIDGFYLSGFSRLAYINAPVRNRYKNDNFDWYWDGKPDKRDSDLKLAAGVGIGYRIFSNKHTYWGTSFSIGRYFIGPNDKYDPWLIDDSEIFFDIELLKFGYAFD